MKTSIFTLPIIAFSILYGCSEPRTEESYNEEVRIQKEKTSNKRKIEQEEFKNEFGSKVEETLNSLLAAVQFVENDEDTSLVVYKLDDQPVCEYVRGNYESPDAFREVKNTVVLRYENLKNEEESTNRFYDEATLRLAAKMQEEDFKFNRDINNRNLKTVLDLASCKYVLISKETNRLEGEILKNDEQKIIGYTKGSVNGFAYLIDLKSGGLIARMPISAVNSDEIDYEKKSVGDIDLSNQSGALSKNLTDQLVEDVYSVMRIAYPK